MVCVMNSDQNAAHTGIVVQQDGARPHIGGRTDWNATLVSQSPQSPDLNLLDLGMKSKADTIKGDDRNIDLCVDTMVKAFEDYASRAIEVVWGVLYLPSYIIYKLPHAGVPVHHRVNGNCMNRHMGQA